MCTRPVEENVLLGPEDSGQHEQGGGEINEYGGMEPAASNNENDDKVEERRCLLRDIMKPQGTITKFLSKSVVFEANSDGYNGGGHLKVGVDGNGVGAKRKTTDRKFSNEQRPRGQIKYKAPAKLKRKRGAK